MTFFENDPQWQAVRELLHTVVQPGQTLLAPNEFLAEFPATIPYNVTYAVSPEQCQVVVLHKGMLTEVDPGFALQVLQQFWPIWRNEVFFVFSQTRPEARSAPLPPEEVRALQDFFEHQLTLGVESTQPTCAIAITTHNQPERLARSLPQLAKLGAPIVIVDDGSSPDYHAKNQQLADQYGATLLTLPTRMGTPTAMNLGISYWLANPQVEWISSFRDGVEVHPDLLRVLGQIQDAQRFPLLTGRDAAEHPTVGQEAIAGYQVLHKRSMPGFHLHAHRDYWRSVLPIPTPPLNDADLQAGRGTEEDWWVTAWAPQSIVKRGGYVLCVPGLVRSQDDAIHDATWGGIRVGEAPFQEPQTVAASASGLTPIESPPAFQSPVSLAVLALPKSDLPVSTTRADLVDSSNLPSLSGVRVLVDGYNLQLTSGTGIKTYGTSLVKTLRQLGAQVDVLLSRNASKANAVLDEVLFYDNQERSRSLLPDLLDASKGLVKSSLGSLFQAKRRASVGQFVVKQGRYTDSFLQYAASFNQPRCYEISNALYRRLRFNTNIHVAEKIDLWHATYPLPITIQGAKKITTVHDLIPLRLPYATLDDKESFYYKVQDALKQSAVVIAVSEHSKKDLLDLFDADPDKIAVTYQPIALEYEEIDPLALTKFLQRYGLEADRYFLFVGAIEPKKNVGRLLDAYAIADTDMPLVIAGKKGWLWEDEIGKLAYLFEGDARKKVKLLEYVPTASLKMLYAGAFSLVFPSLYEGFGLPPIEAMTFGCPVITSYSSCLPEVCGNAALYVDPYDVSTIKNQMERMIDQPRLRQDLIEMGYENAAYFSTENYAQRLSLAYAKALQ